MVYDLSYSRSEDGGVWMGGGKWSQGANSLCISTAIQTCFPVQKVDGGLGHPCLLAADSHRGCIITVIVVIFSY